MVTYFISDLHLDPVRPHTSDLLFAFLANRAVTADALYILGDLFEVWIGDDDRSGLAQAVAVQLAMLSSRGVPIYFIHGNRDFLLGQKYADEAGLTILDEAVVIDLYGQRTLIMHGDTLCTDDHPYLEFRARVRSPRWQRRTLGLPLWARRWLARRLRRKSHRAQLKKTLQIMDVNSVAVARVMSEYKVTRLIHGHTHRPAIHQIALAQASGQRIVLGDWEKQGSVLVCNRAGCELEILAP